MSIDYAKELVAVDCGRIVETLDAMGEDAELTDEERECLDELRRAAMRGVAVFGTAEGDGR